MNVTYFHLKLTENEILWNPNKFGPLCTIREILF